MVGVCDETEAQMKQMCQAYERLRARHPNHRLLGFISLNDAGDIHFNPKYFRRCCSKHDEHNFQSDGRYTSALEAAFNGQPYACFLDPDRKSKHRRRGEVEEEAQRGVDLLIDDC